MNFGCGFLWDSTFAVVNSFDRCYLIYIHFGLLFHSELTQNEVATYTYFRKKFSMARSCLNWRMVVWTTSGFNKTTLHAIQKTKQFIERNFWWTFYLASLASGIPLLRFNTTGPFSVRLCDDCTYERYCKNMTPIAAKRGRILNLLGEEPVAGQSIIFIKT